MTETEVEKHYKRFLRRIQREPICEPDSGEHVDRCYYSKTGWAIWRNGCSCKPAKPPKTHQE